MRWCTERMTAIDLDLLERLQAIEEMAFAEAGMNPWFLVPFMRHGRIYVIRSDAGITAGLAEYMKNYEEDDLVYLFGVSVDPQYQGHGLGKQLLQESLKDIRRDGILKVELTVEPNNAVAMALYHDLGFEETEYRPDEYGPGQDRVAMELVLSRLKEDTNA